MRETWYMAQCRDCNNMPAMPFSVAAERLAWCVEHKRGHAEWGDLDTVIDTYEELQRYRMTYVAVVDDVHNKCTLVCGVEHADKRERMIHVDPGLGSLLPIQSMINAVDAHYKEWHGDA